MTAVQSPLFLFRQEQAKPARAAAKKTTPKPRHRRPRPTVPDPAAHIITSAGVWTVTFPAPDRLMSINTGKHWRITSPVKKAWRNAMYLHAHAAKLPTGLRRVRIDVELRFPTAAKHDAPNYHPYVVKPIVDALGPGRQYTVRKGSNAGTLVVEPGYGLIPDDTAEYLDGPFPCVGEPVRDKAMPFGQVAVTITDLTGEVAV